MGNEWIQTPALDSLCADSVVFDQHYSDYPDPKHFWASIFSGNYTFFRQFSQLKNQDFSKISEWSQNFFDTLISNQIRTILVAKLDSSSLSNLPWEYQLDSCSLEIESPIDALLESIEAGIELFQESEKGFLVIEIDSLIPPWAIDLQLYREYAAPASLVKELDQLILESQTDSSSFSSRIKSQVFNNSTSITHEESQVDMNDPIDMGIDENGKIDQNEIYLEFENTRENILLQTEIIKLPSSDRKEHRSEGDEEEIPSESEPVSDNLAQNLKDNELHALELLDSPEQIGFDSESFDEEESETIFHPPTGQVTLETQESWDFLHDVFATRVTMVDQVIQQMIELFNQHQLGESALWVISSGFGQPLGEHELIGWSSACLYEEMIHLPLIMRFPDKKFAGRRIDYLTQPVDLAPTFFDFFRISNPPKMDGYSLIPSILSIGSHQDQAILEKLKILSHRPILTGIHSENEIRMGIRTPQHFYIEVEVADGGENGNIEQEKQIPELYLKPIDRFEVNNLIQQYLEYGDYLQSVLHPLIQNQLGDIEIPSSIQSYEDWIADFHLRKSQEQNL